MKCKGPGHSKLPHKITVLHVHHLPMPQSPARESASVTASLRGTGVWAEPFATVSLLEASRFYLRGQSRA